MSFLREDAFGMSSTFVGLRNYTRLFDNPNTSTRSRSRSSSRSQPSRRPWGCRFCWRWGRRPDDPKRARLHHALVWPYAVAPAVAGFFFFFLWWFIFNPTIGIMPYVLENLFGYDWNHALDP